MRRSRKPLLGVSSVEGSNPSPSVRLSRRVPFSVPKTQDSDFDRGWLALPSRSSSVPRLGIDPIDLFATARGRVRIQPRRQDPRSVPFGGRHILRPIRPCKYRDLHDDAPKHPVLIPRSKAPVVRTRHRHTANQADFAAHIQESMSPKPVAKVPPTDKKQVQVPCKVDYRDCPVSCTRIPAPGARACAAAEGDPRREAVRMVVPCGHEMRLGRPTTPPTYRDGDPRRDPARDCDRSRVHGPVSRIGRSVLRRQRLRADRGHADGRPADGRCRATHRRAGCVDDSSGKGVPGRRLTDADRPPVPAGSRHDAWASTPTSRAAGDGGRRPLRLWQPA